MAYTTIDDPSEYFITTLYAGNGNDDRSITNDANAGNFKPDWLWLKNRSGTNSHALVDSTRGSTKVLRSNATNAEETEANGIQAFETDGFQIGSGGLVNTDGNNYVAWQWKANGGTATATISESGNNPAATVQANTTAGFSIITYTGTGSEGTIAHGLGATPKFIVAKNRDAGEGWIIDSSILTGNSNGTLHFNTDAEYTGGSNQFGTHSSTNITIKTAGNINTDGQKYVAYVFAPIQGYSKMGSFIGNNSSDGAFVYLGFKPRWIMVKNTTQSHANHSWIIFDSARETNNEIDTFLEADTNAADVTSGRNEVDFLSNGFKARASYGDFNGGSGHVFVYMAFAEHPFVSSKGVPTTAR